MNKKMILPTLAFTIAALMGGAAQGLAAEKKQSVSKDFSAAACLIQKNGHFLLPMTKFKSNVEMSLPIRKKKYAEVKKAIADSGVDRNDSLAVAGVVARSGARAELGLPMNKVSVLEKVGEIPTRRGPIILFNCASSARPNMNQIQSRKVIGVEWVNPDTMRNDRGQPMPPFFKGKDRAFLQELKRR